MLYSLMVKETCFSHKNKIIVGNTEDSGQEFERINIINN